MKFGKKSTYIISLVCLVVLSVLFFFVPNDGLGWWLMMIFQVLISICTGIVSPLIWSMYADVADYAEQKDGTSSTGLIFSSGSMAQKFGGAFAGWAVMALLAFFGYNTAENAVQTPEALDGLKYLMSLILLRRAHGIRYQLQAKGRSCCPLSARCAPSVVRKFYPLMP